MKNPVISVIIPTYKRKASIMHLLTSLTRVLTVSAEILIVEQGISNKEEIVSFAKKIELHIRYFFLANASTPRAKNLGANNAQGEFLLFIDDDVLVAPGILEAHIKNLKNEKVAAVSGRAITVGQDVRSQKIHVGRISFLGSFSDGFSSDIRQSVDTVIGCNAAWKRDVFLKTGGFDEKFTGNALREESDLSLRAKSLGYDIVFEPTALVIHLREASGGTRKTEGRMRWYFDFFSNEVYFFLRHRPKLLLPLFLLTRSQWAVRCMFGFGRELSLRSLSTPTLGIIDGIKKSIT